MQKPSDVTAAGRADEVKVSIFLFSSSFLTQSTAARDRLGRDFL
jgi:hypothetical protein